MADKYTAIDQPIQNVPREVKPIELVYAGNLKEIAKPTPTAAAASWFNTVGKAKSGFDII
jgi:hypothetical protein